MRAHAPACYLAASLAASLAAAPPIPVPSPAADDWRPVHLAGGREEDLQERLQRGFQGLFGEVLEGVRVEAPGAYLETEGEAFQVVLPRLTLHFQGLEGWSGSLTGRLEGEDLRVEYAPLGVGEVRFPVVPELEGHLRSAAEDLEASLRRDAFTVADLHFDESGLRLDGKLEFRLLFLAIRPELELEGYFARRGERFVFEPTRTYVSNVPGFLRARLRDRLDRRSAEGFGLDRAMAGLRRRGIRLGPVRLEHTRAGEVVRSAVLPQLMQGFDDLPSE